MNAPDQAPTQAVVGKQERPLLPALLAQATQMNFFRFCELLELAAPHLPALGSTDSLGRDPVRFRSRQGLGFPNREIDTVEHDDDDPTAPPAVRTTFFGLYGVDARMPSYFIDEIAQNQEGAEPLAAFLDLFHHRIITQFYRVWRKYRYPAGFRSNGQDEISRYLLSFAGLGIAAATPVQQQVGTRKLLSMLGLAGQKTRTAEGLAGVLQHVVPDTQIAVQEFYPVWIALTDFERMPLGQNCVLGRGFYDRTNAILLVLRPQSRESLLGLMPGQAQHKEVMALLQFYLGYAAQVRLHMEAWPEWMPEPILNSTAVRLGYSSRLPVTTLTKKKDHVVRVQLGIYNGSGMKH